MKTIYCTLDARRLTHCGAAGRKASGGEAVCYAVAPRRPEARPASPEESPAPAKRPLRSRGRRPSLALTADLLASAAVVALLAAVVVQLAAL